MWIEPPSWIRDIKKYTKQSTKDLPQTKQVVKPELKKRNDETFKILSDCDERETQILGVWRYTKNKAILQITGIVSNTGNLGIPFGLLLYGPESVPYTAMINLANSIFVCTFGAYRYSRGTFPISKSFINVLKLPMIWSAGLAIFWQLMHWEFNQQLMQIFEMAAYSTMVLQLMIFGMFIATIQRNQLEIKNIVIVQLTKYVLLPVLMVVIIPTTSLPDLAAKCLLLQSIMPIAVNNMNLAALYNCYPQKVAIHAILSTAIALIIVPMIV